MIEIQIDSEGRGRTLSIRGEVDLDVSPQLWSAIEEAINGTGTLSIRLAEVSYIDSSGIATLVKGLRHAQKHKVDYALLDPSDQVRAVIELARLDRLFSIQSSSE